MGKEREAVINGEASLLISEKIGDKETSAFTHNHLATAYADLQNFKKAYEHHVLFKNIRDSIFNTENSKALSDLKTNFEVERKEVEMKARAGAEKEKMEAINRAEKKHQNTVIFFLAIVIVFVAVALIVVINRFRITKKQKKLIEEQKILVEQQKQLVEVKQEEILDSIRYAKRIQSALITSEFYIYKSLHKLNSKN